MVLLAWMCAVLGAAVAFVVSLAGAMRTVPRLYWQEALVAVPLPVLAAALACWRSGGPLPSTPGLGHRPWVSGTLALGLALLTLLFVAFTYLAQPDGPR